ncbi:endopeptidase La, partial [candidate division TA06 bacterium]
RNFYRRYDLHVHIPEGAIPKDGPSAGVAIATAMVSALTATPVRRDVAMTGEITLRGKVLPVGGLSEKIVAAQRAGIKTVIVPKKNSKDIKELPERAKHGVEIRLVSSQDEVLRIALKKNAWKEKRMDTQHPTYASS